VSGKIGCRFQTKLHFADGVNHFCIVTLIGQIKPSGCLKTRTTCFIKDIEWVLSSSQGQIILNIEGICGPMSYDIAIGRINHFSHFLCHIGKSEYTHYNA